MVTTLIIAGTSIALMFGSVLVKPYIRMGKFRLGLYWIICLAGALIMLLTGSITFEKAISGITANTSVNPLKILTLFISMTILSEFLDEAGFFGYLADRIFLRAHGSQYKLFFALYFTVSILTVFTSNDIVVLTFTPFICMFAKKAKISPVPYLIGEFIAANTWSMMLIIGNPTNIYLAGSYGITFTEYFIKMWLPTLGGGIAGLAVIMLLFKKQLTEKVDYDDIEHEHVHVKPQRVPLIVALSHLGACIILLAVSEFINLEMWIICLSLAVSLIIFNLIYGIIKDKNVKHVLNALKKAPYELIPFVLSMFVIVLSLSECGLTDILASALVKGDRTDAVLFGGLSAISANLLNNIPMSVLFEQIVHAKSAYALYGAVIGSNIGAFITPVGALAGIMWNKILHRHEIHMPFYKFFLYGLSVAIPTLLISCGLLMII